jgi:hypothetical protein
MPCRISFRHMIYNENRGIRDWVTNAIVEWLYLFIFLSREYEGTQYMCYGLKISTRIQLMHIGFSLMTMAYCHESIT